MTKTVMVYLPPERRDERREELRSLAAGVGGVMPGIIFQCSTPHNALVNIPDNRVDYFLDSLDDAGFNTITPRIIQ